MLDLTNKHIILASKSPRRQQLFKDLGVNFTIKTMEIDESFPSNLKAEEITNFIAVKKADAFDSELKENEILVTSDTTVWHNGKALEKPKDRAHAIEMLQSYSNTFHKVITSVCLKSNKKSVVFHDVTEVHFKELTQEEIEYYVDNYNPYDKAGAYGIQEWIGFVGVTKIVGSYFNVMGFPMHKFYEELSNF